MTLRARIKQLEAGQDSADGAPGDCICELVIVEGGTTLEQQATLARNATCKASHIDKGFFVVEVPPMPEWMKGGQERPPHTYEDR